MSIQFTPEEQVWLNRVAGAANQLGLEAYLVGGFVRDKLLGRPTKDADFVCVGDALQLAQRAAESFSPKPTVTLFKTFGTAHFQLKDGWDLEFVGARRESYQSNSRKPQVEPGTIQDDQLRRDLTINALAILNEEPDLIRHSSMIPFG